MPLYVYSCTKCKYCEEKLETISALPIQACPKCKHNNTFIREISSSSFIVVGMNCKNGYSKK